MESIYLNIHTYIHTYNGKTVERKGKEANKGRETRGGREKIESERDVCSILFTHYWNIIIYRRYFILYVLCLIRFFYC